MPSLTVVSGPNEGDYYPLGARTLVIGRDEAVPIQITDELVSRRHAQIRQNLEQQSYCLLDMNSANGTLVNGRKIETELILVDDDLIEVGTSKIMYSSQDFPDRDSALLHYNQRGERGISTLIR